jgi:hypothetical protein
MNTKEPWIGEDGKHGRKFAPIQNAREKDPEKMSMARATLAFNNLVPAAHKLGIDTLDVPGFARPIQVVHKHSRCLNSQSLARSRAIIAALIKAFPSGKLPLSY